MNVARLRQRKQTALRVMANNIWYKFKSEVQWKGLKFEGLDITVAEIKQLVLVYRISSGTCNSNWGLGRLGDGVESISLTHTSLSRAYFPRRTALGPA